MVWRAFVLFLLLQSPFLSGQSGLNSNDLRLRDRLRTAQAPAQLIAGQIDKALAPTASSFPTRWSELRWGPVKGLDHLGSIAGAVSGIVVDPRNSEVVYTSSMGGGVWKTTDSGAHWRPTFDRNRTLEIGAVALDADDPDTVYAIAGATPADIYGYWNWDWGLFGSTDGGATWVDLGRPPVSYYPKIAVQPGHPLSVLISSLVGNVYRSTDGGLTWQRALACDSVYSLLYARPSAYVVCKTYPNDLELWRSDDGGERWTKITPYAAYPGNGAIVGASDSGALYFTGLAWQGSNLVPRLARSNDRGATWTIASESWWIGGLLVNPADSNMIVATCMLGASLCLSRDGGLTFTDVGTTIGPETTALAFGSDGTLYAGNHYGIWSSKLLPGTLESGTDSYGFPIEIVAWRNLNRTLRNMQLRRDFSVAQDGSGLIVAGTPTTGAIAGSPGRGWQQEVRGRGVGAALSSDGTAYAAFVFPLNIYSSTSTLSRSFRPLDPNSWQTVVQDGVDPSSLAVSPADPHTIYVREFPVNTLSSEYSIFRSSDDGDTWTQTLNSIRYFYFLAGDAFDPATVFSVDTYNPDYVVMAHVPTNSPPSSFFNTCGGNHETNSPFGLRVNPYNDDVWLLGAYEGWPGRKDSSLRIIGPCRSQMSVSPGDGSQLFDVAFDPAIPNTVYGASFGRVLVSYDSGATWNPFGAGLPNTRVAGLGIDPVTRTLYAATYGRGMWTASLPPPPLPTIEPGSLNFAKTRVGDTSTPLMVMLTNPRLDALRISTVSASADFTVANDCPSLLHGGEQCSLLVSFQPKIARKLRGELSVTTSASTAPLIVALSGMAFSASDFTVSANPSALSILPGRSGNTTLILMPQNGFSGNVNLECGDMPTGLKCSLAKHQITLSGESAVAVKVTIAVASWVRAWALPMWLPGLEGSSPRRPVNRQYRLTITSRSGDLQHTTALTVTVRHTQQTD
ncbi:MAG TPA: choice-of-anchor D domain-containing protein [Terriglobales bacterium]|nr:choice-of-anchor D domain-containing protein [Terriglobales bacterium]